MKFLSEGTVVDVVEVLDLAAVDSDSGYKVLAEALFEPTPEKLAASLARWADEGVRWLGAFEDDRPVSLVGWSGGDPTRVVCLGTAPDRRGRGLASALVAALVERVGGVEAETDASAVEFYRRAGFAVTAFDRDYGGTRVQRFRCRREAAR